MKGLLQFCATENGSYLNVGTLRSRKRKAYTVDPIIGKNRIEQAEIVGFRVRATALALTLHASFLDEIQWYFRVKFPDDSLMIKLGQHYYTIDYDGLVVLNEIEYHQVDLDFTIDIDDYSDYSTPITLVEA